jgi:hypothetical protein
MGAFGYRYAMNFLKGLFITMIVGSLWMLSGVITHSRIEKLERLGLLPYGPVPDVQSTNYSYEGLNTAFDSRLPLKRASELSKDEFEDIILSSVNPNAQKELKPLMRPILDFSVQYQMDPFWIVSIIMVESNFKHDAVSAKNARGIMQIKPDTAQHLYQLMQKTLTDEQVSQNLYRPEENIEVGVFYLKKLLQNFRMNYHFATVAYNIGPARLRNRLVDKSLDVDNFSYLVKVKEKYVSLSQNFSRSMKIRSLPFEGTYVYSEQGLKLEERMLKLFPLTTSENLTAKF